MYCPICGLTPLILDTTYFINIEDCLKCDFCVEKNKWHVCKNRVYEMPKEDEEFLETVRVLLSDGNISSCGTSDWPGPVTCYDDNGNIITYNNIPKSYHSEDEIDGIMIHSVCVDLLKQSVLLNKLTWQQIYNFLYKNCDGHKMILKKYDYGFISKSQRQNYELYKGEEWALNHPNQLPSPKTILLHNQNKTNIQWKRNNLEKVFDILFIFEYIDNIHEFLQLKLTCKSFYQYLTSPLAVKYIWKKICISKYMILDKNDLCDNNINWHKFAIMCNNNLNYKNRMRIMDIINYIVSNIKKI